VGIYFLYDNFLASFCRSGCSLLVSDAKDDLSSPLSSPKRMWQRLTPRSPSKRSADISYSTQGIMGNVVHVDDWFPLEGVD
jgi:hypothetical protein